MPQSPFKTTKVQRLDFAPQTLKPTPTTVKPHRARFGVLGGVAQRIPTTFTSSLLHGGESFGLCSVGSFHQPAKT